MPKNNFFLLKDKNQNLKIKSEYKQIIPNFVGINMLILKMSQISVKA